MKPTPLSLRTPLSLPSYLPNDPSYTPHILQRHFAEGDDKTATAPVFDAAKFMADLNSSFDTKLNALKTDLKKDIDLKLASIKSSSAAEEPKDAKKDDTSAASSTTTATTTDDTADGREQRGVDSAEVLRLKGLEREVAKLKKERDAEKEERKAEREKGIKLLKKSAVSDAVANKDLDWASESIASIIRRDLENQCEVLEDGSVVVGEDKTPVKEYAINLYKSDENFQASKARAGSGNTDKTGNKVDPMKDILSKDPSSLTEADRAVIRTSALGQLPPRN